MQWPGNIKGARKLLNTLPEQLNGESGEVFTDPRDKVNAGAQYGRDGRAAMISVQEEHISDDTADGQPELISANNLLAANFLIGAICTKGSYKGTAPRESSGLGPAPTEKPLAKDIWFSCRMETDWGEEEVTGHAVGWTSKKTSWLVTAKNEKFAKALIAALGEPPGK